MITPEERIRLDKLIALGDAWTIARLQLDAATNVVNKAREVFQKEIALNGNSDLYYKRQFMESDE